MIDLGPHAAFIIGSYAVTVLAIGALVAWIVADGKAQQRAITDLESKGARRRSRKSSASGDSAS